MHNNQQTALNVSKRFISLTLAFTMIFNLTGQALAAVPDKPKMPDLSQIHKTLDKKVYTAVQDQTAAPMRQIELSRKVMQETLRINNGKLTTDELHRLFDIETIFNPILRTKEQKNISPDKEFTNQLNIRLNRENKKVKEEVTRMRLLLAEKLEKLAKKGKTVEEVKEQQEKFEKEISDWEATVKSKIADWKKTQTEAYANQMAPVSLQEREQIVAKVVKDLWEMKDKAPVAKRTLIVLSPRILPLRKLNGESFFTDAQKRVLEALYRSTLRHNQTCVSKNNVPNCETVMASISGLGMVSDDAAAARDIVEFMEANSETVVAVSAILAGSAALLAMKQYAPLRGFIYSATDKERDISAKDFLSTETWIREAGNMNGQYLGEVSKFAAYPLTEKATEDSAMGNAWEDLALLLAQDGSKESLSMLKEFGVDRCAAFSERKLNGDLAYRMTCTGIIPFLAGALESGKSGAENYSPKTDDIAPGYYIDNNGSYFVSPERAAQNLQRQQGRIKIFQYYTSLTGLTPAAAIARHLFNQSMGDLNADSELELDQKLFLVYANAAKMHAPKPGYAIKSYVKGSTEYNAKRVRQDRLHVWLNVSHYADIAILVYCLFDISKWAMKGGKIVTALARASKMARQGATVAERAIMLRRLNITPQLRTLANIPGKIRTGMSPAVNAQMPLFASVTKMPRIEGFVESAAKVTASNTQFAAEVGLLSVDSKNIFSASNLTPAQLNTINKELALASENTNLIFANRTKVNQFIKGNGNQAYRKVLAQEINKLPILPTYTQADMSTLAFRVSNTPSITVPANIASFKTPSLFTGKSTLSDDAVVQVMTKTLKATPETADVNHSISLMNEALQDANVQYANRSWFTRGWQKIKGKDNQVYKDMLLSSMAKTFDKDGLLFTDLQQRNLYRAFMASIQNDTKLKAPSALRKFQSMPVNPEKTSYKTMGTAVLSSADAAVLPVDLPLNIYADTGISGVRGAGTYQRIILTDKKGSYFFGVGNDLSKPFQPNNFKVTLMDKDLPYFISAVQKANISPLTPFELKLTPLKQPGLWNQAKNFSFRSLARSKKNIYVDDVKVFNRNADGTLARTSLLLKADSNLGLKGAEMVLENGQMHLYRASYMLKDQAAFSYGVPKTKLKPFVDIIQDAKMDYRFNLKITSTRSKLLPLYVATGLSLSSASTGLIAPLENIYGNRITDTDKTWISLAFPYLPSIAAPMFSPLVMKIGALTTVKAALLTSTLGLGFAWANGFTGKLNESNLPPIWPLFVSGAAIGVSSALSRSGLNLLIDQIGGGGTLLKSMAYKNIGSFALLVPPVLYNMVKGPGAGDFSLAFPVLTTASGLSFASLYLSRIDGNIGKVAGFMKFKPLVGGFKVATQNATSNMRTILSDGWKETWSSVRILGSKELLPLTAAAFTFTGFEAASFNKASNQLIRPEVSEFEWVKNIHPDNQKNIIALITSGTVVLFPMLTRFGAKPAMAALANPLKEGIEYKRMLKLSYALNLTGGAMLMHYGFDGFTSPGFVGIALIGLGTANVTQSLQKLSNLKVLHGDYVMKSIAGLDAVAATTFRKATVTKAMTVFPVSQTGLAVVPLIVSGYTDKHVEEGIEKSSEVPQTSLWIPLTSIGASAGFAGASIGLLPKSLQTGLFGLSKGIFGSYSQAFKNTFKPLPPPFTAPYGYPTGFVPQPADIPVVKGLIK